MTLGRSSNDPLDKYIKEHGGNEFFACVCMANEASRLVDKCDQSVSGSEALTCVIEGRKPKDLRKRMEQHMNVSVPSSEYAKSLLAYVDSSDVVKCVKESFSQSVRIGSLTFYYPVKVSQADKARVRVLTRMCWHNR